MQVSQLYQDVTTRIVEAIEAGNLPPWRQPWKNGGGFLPLRHNGVNYRGGNVILLWMVMNAKGFDSPYFFTFRQAGELGGAVKRGEKGTHILYCEPIRKKETAEDGTEAESRFWLTKTYVVFNACQISGLPDRYTIKPSHGLDLAQRIEQADTFIANTKADIRHGGNSAYYRPSGDYIQLPDFGSFDSGEAYAATALHELHHWAGAPHRLNREQKPVTDRKAYSNEEIVAELGSILTCATLGITPPDMGQHAAYLEFLVQALKQDARFLFTMASKAQASADYLQSLQPKE